MGGAADRRRALGAFCTRSCPFSSPSSSFTSKSLQSWTRNASRNASESGWKRSNWRSRKPPVHQREPRVAAVSDFPDTAGRVSAGSQKPDVAPPCGRIENSTEAQRSGFSRKRKCGKRGTRQNGKNLAILDAAARKQDKRMASEPTLFLFTTARSADCIKRLRRRCDWRLFGEK